MAKWSTFTKSNKCTYALPEGKRVLGVGYAQQVFIKELGIFFVNSDYVPLWKVTHANESPTSASEGLEMLKQAYAVLEVPMWAAVDGMLLIWPPAMNDGDVLVVEIDDAD